MTHNETKRLVLQAWGKLIRAYLFSFAASLATGYILIEWASINPEKIFDITTRRLSAAGAIFEKSLAFGIDPAILRLAHQTIFIPMIGFKRSLNVSSAFAIVSYTLRFNLN